MPRGERINPPGVHTPQANYSHVTRVGNTLYISGQLGLDGDGTLVGIVSESDFVGKERGVPFTAFHAPSILGQWLAKDGVERIYEAARRMRARDIMTSPVETLTEATTVTEVVRRMIRHDLKRLPVVRDGRPVGMVTHHDLLRIVAPAAASATDAGR